MLVGSSGHIYQTLAPRLVARLWSFSHSPEHRNVRMDNPPEKMAAALKRLAGSRVVMSLLCLQVEDDQKLRRYHGDCIIVERGENISGR